MKRENIIKTILINIIAISGFLCLLPIHIKAYDIPQTSCYIHAKDSSLGDVYIYVPCNSSTLFSVTDDGQLILVSSSTVTGYLSTTEDYTINFRPYFVGRYRRNSSYDYSYLDFVEIYEDTNVYMFDSKQQFIARFSDFMTVGAIIFIGGVLCLIYMKR